MPYHTKASVTADVPAAFLLEALDDNRDGTEDAGLYDQLAANASESVDAYLGGRFAVPFTTDIPPLAITASRIFCLESLYGRRGYSKDTDPPNPWYAQAEAIRDRLKRIASGSEPLRPEPGSVAPVVTVTEPSRTTSAGGRMGY
jgi:phage gp36-like protein